MTIDANSFNAALEEIEVSKGITRDTVLAALEEALIKGYRKQLGGDDADVRVNIDAEKGIIEMWQVKVVKEDVQDDFLEISVEDANEGKKKPQYKDGDEYFIEASIDDLRKATAMSIKSIMHQKFAEAEKNILYEAFKDKIGTIITGKVEKVDEKGVTVNLVRTSVYLPHNQLIGEEKFNVGDQIKVYIHNVDSGTKGAKIVVSRSNEGFLRCILNEEVSDIYNGTVIVKGIAREAGERSKIAVYSPDPNIDPAGACIGPNGTKIQKVVGQLGNGQAKEKIDVIAWSENPGLFIIEALKPARVAGVIVEAEKKSAIAIVKDDSFSLAIGRKGANVRLAVKLTGYHIDIKVESEAIESGLSYQTIEELQAMEIERKNKLVMELAAQRAAEMAAATAARNDIKPATTVLPGLPEGYVAPQDRVYEDTTDDEINEALEAEVESSEEIVAPVEEAPVAPVVEEAKAEEPVAKTEVKTTTSLADLEASLDSSNDSKKNTGKKKFSKKKDEEEDKDSKKGVTDTSNAARMSIYTDEELAELEAEESEEDYEDEDDVDYDEYDDYYDEDNR
ncbi:MAG: transcription termination factor NusA [Bacilli bacterium]|nr:transcription termination factor NusA [Bacilli bacterium]